MSSLSVIMVADPFVAVVMTGADHMPVADAMWVRRDAYLEAQWSRVKDL